MAITSMWSDLPVPWQAAVEMAWEAYCSGTNPIGAVITNPSGEVIIRERNHIEEENVPGRIHHHQLAHAELNALLQFDSFAPDRAKYALYTTMEPCPLCIGAIYMSGLRTVHFAVHDDFAGSADMLGKTWYMSRKPVRAFAPSNAILESVLLVLDIDFKLRFNGIEELEGMVIQRWLPRYADQVALGAALYNTNELSVMREGGIPASQMFETIAAKVKR